MSEHNHSESEQTTAGELLKKSREEQGYTIEEIHDVTKIPMDALRAIEEDYTIRTLSPFYRKSFTKIYAKYLNLDPVNVLKEEIKPVKKDTSTVRKPIRNSVDYPDKIRTFLKSIFTPLRIKQIGVICGIILFCFLLFKGITGVIGFVAKSFKGKQARVETVQEAPVQGETPAQTGDTARPQQASRSAPVRTQNTPVNQNRVTSSKDVRMTVRSTKKSWVRVKADNEVVFQSVLQKGVVESWEADEKIELSGGIDKLEFEVNGKLIGKLGRRDRQAKSVVITKDGLVVSDD